MASIFLSHSSRDKFFVRELADRLKAHGVTVWLDEAELKIGDSLTERIGSAIEENDYLGIVLSRNSIDSAWVQKELQVAMQRELREKRVVVLPLLLEEVVLPPFLKDKLYADFTDPKKYDEALPRVLKALGVPDTSLPTVTQPKPDNSHLTVISPSQRRLEAFQDIHIIDLDLQRSYNPEPEMALLNMYLKLSGNPPSDWKEIFDAERRFPRHTMWRRAWSEGDYIVVYCVPDELEKYHLRDLREDVLNANQKYRKYLTEIAQKDAIDATKQKQEEEKLNEMKKRLGFV